MNTSLTTIVMPSSVAPRLAWTLLAVMVVQSASGLAAPHLYRDIEWIRTTWYGNDWITLLLACPLLSLALLGHWRHAPRWQLLRIGLVGYSVYNYAFYMFGAALNPFFLLYIIAFVVAIATLVAIFASVNTESLAASFSPRTPARLIAGFMIAVAFWLSAVWIGMWARHVFAGGVLPATPEVFRLVAALDLSFMVPALTLGGVLLWRRNAWGFPVSSLALLQSGLYLLILSVNSFIAVARGLVPWPGELLVWAPLCVATSIAAFALVASAHASPDDRASPSAPEQPGTSVTP